MSPFFCKKCGEEEEFMASYTQRVDYETNMDRDGIVDYNGGEEVDGGEPEGEDYTCDNCSEEVEDLDDDKITEHKIKHIDNDGKWHEEELPRKEWNEKMLLKYGAEKL